MATTRVLVVPLNEYGRRIGEHHPNARISDETVDRIRELHEDFGWGYLAICAELKLSLTAVRKICTYERRAQTPFKWKRMKVTVEGGLVDALKQPPGIMKVITKLESICSTELLRHREAFISGIRKVRK